ncbi:uncharacterized protein G2W53_025788 [Senna tora]|uniref:Uncharacterized protein n=1 Tax=Senna tora TaxID=362788 RepID=A0A834TDW7_9FABA|nr:uncharacterized protein G2W53_025788 [Senna tora]
MGGLLFVQKLEKNPKSINGEEELCEMGDKFVVLEGMGEKHGLFSCVS